MKAADEEQCTIVAGGPVSRRGRREVLVIVLVLISLFWNAPLEGLADPMRTPNPAKAPWYFLGLQELLHYFPPVVAGVLIPTLVVLALIVIPYFNVNVEAEGVWTRTGASDSEYFLVFAGADGPGCIRSLGAACTHDDQLAAHGRRGRQPRQPRDSRFRSWLSANPFVLDHDLVPVDLVVLTAMGHFSADRAGPGYGPGGA